MRRLIAAGAVLGLSLGLVQADSPKPVGDSLNLLVEQLGDRDFKVREAAGKALEALGETHLAAMKKALETSKNPEARKRLQTLILNGERNAALAPKRISLRLIDRPVQEVIAEISRQTGYKMQVQGNGGVNVSIDVSNETYWKVMDDISLQTGLVAQHNEGQAIQLYSQDVTYPYVCRQGAIKITANQFNYSKSRALGGFPKNPQQAPGRHENLQFSFNVMSEPKLPIMQVHQPRVVEAVDDLGNSMVPTIGNGHQSYYYGGGGYRTYHYSSQLQLVWPNKEAQTVKLLRGSIPITVLAYQKPDVTVADILKVKNQKFSSSNTEIEVIEVKENNKNSFQIKMKIKNLAPNSANDYTWTNSVHQRIELQDGKGNKYYSQGYNWENNSPSNVTATFMFGSNGDVTLGPPARLIFNYWGLLQQQVDFEFRDLPLP